MTNRIGTLLVSACLLSLGSSAVADAATVTWSPGDDTLNYTDSGAQPTTLTITEAAGALILEDVVALTPVGSCVHQGPQTRLLCSGAASVGRVVVRAGGGANVVRALISNDTTIYGMSNAENSLTGGSGDDTLIGGSGDDTLDGGLGADELVGGAGVDLANYTSRTAAVHVTIGSWFGANDGGSGEHDDVAHDIEMVMTGSGDDLIRAPDDDVERRLHGLAGADVIIGGSGDEFLDGASGADTLLGAGGSDALVGGDGDDLLDGGAGRDQLNGLDGWDTVSYADRTAAVFVDLDGSDGDDGAEAEGDTVGVSVERVLGGSGDDVLTGNDQANALLGGPGSDTVDGGAGSDQLLGDTGDDLLRSADGAIDAVDCGSGTDTSLADATDARVDCELPAPPTQQPPGQQPPAQQPPDRQPPAQAPIVTISLKTVRATKSGIVKVRVACPETARGSCTGTLRLVHKRRAQGSQRFTIAAGASKVLRVRLSKQARAALRPSRKLALTAAASVSDAAAGPLVTKRRLMVKRAG